jgi:alpha-galactosidase
MLETGNGMTATEDRTEITLWAMMAAPLIVGTDLVHASAATQRLLTNRAVVAVDQDPLGQPARRDNNVLTRELAGGDVAVALLNEGDTPEIVAANAPAGRHHLTDLWTGTTTTIGATIRATIEPHGAVLYRATW